MSHVADVETRIHDLDVLESAAAMFGLRLARGQKTHRWFGRFLNDWSDKERAAVHHGLNPATFGKCEHALCLKSDRGDAYEIGVTLAEDGNGYRLVYDAWAGGKGLEAAAGVGLANLTNEYTAQVTERALWREGCYAVDRVANQETGQIDVIGYLQ